MGRQNEGEKKRKAGTGKKSRENETKDSWARERVVEWEERERGREGGGQGGRKGGREGGGGGGGRGEGGSPHVAYHINSMEEHSSRKLGGDSSIKPAEAFLAPKFPNHLLLHPPAQPRPPQERDPPPPKNPYKNPKTQGKKKREI